VIDEFAIADINLFDGVLFEQMLQWVHAGPLYWYEKVVEATQLKKHFSQGAGARVRHPSRKTPAVDRTCLAPRAL